MYHKKLESDIRCPLEYGLEVFGGKWKSRVICVLADKKTLRYSELRAELVNITDAVLSTTLKALIADDIVSRKSYDEIPPRVEYSLTEKGLSVMPILQSIWMRGRLLCEKNNLPFQINIYCVKCYIELPKRYTGEQ